jgi:hypothetical protein
VKPEGLSRGAVAEAAARPPSPRTVAGWILPRPDALPESERLKLEVAFAGQVRAFERMLTQHRGAPLPHWIKAVRVVEGHVNRIK